MIQCVHVAMLGHAHNVLWFYIKISDRVIIACVRMDYRLRTVQTLVCSADKNITYH